MRLFNRLDKKHSIRAQVLNIEFHKAKVDPRDLFLFLLSLYASTKIACARRVRTDSFHCEHRCTTKAMGRPMQRICMTTPIIIIRRENGYFMALDSGTTTRFMKK